MAEETGNKVKIGPEEFFDSIQDFFHSLARQQSVIRREYNIADLTCRTEIVGDLLAKRLGRALAHRQIPQSVKPDLVIRAWDGNMIRPPWTELDYGPRGLIRGFNTERFCTMFDHGTGSLSTLDRERAVAFFWTRNAENLPIYETSAPLRTIFGWWMAANSRTLVHAAAVATGKGAVLLTGRGGSGKSTAALLCLKAGWQYLADDYCIVQPGNPPKVFSLYHSAKVSRPWLAHLGMPSDTHSEAMDDKELLFINELWPEKVAGSAVCRLGLLPVISGERQTSIGPATKGEALRALGPSTIFQNAVSGRDTLQLLAGLIEQLPTRKLNLGCRLDQIPVQIDNCLNSFR